jgi:SpoIID/LytB domain protein
LKYLGNLIARHRLRVFASAALCVVAIWAGGLPHQVTPFRAVANRALNEDDADAALQRAATSALGQRDGTIIIMDPQTGRVRAVVNSTIAFESSFAPGSTIKPFTALAALRAGLINKDSTTLCRERYSRKDFNTVCAHPRNLPPFTPAEAIGYSCNYYFGTLGERLPEEQLSETLGSFGFGKRTFVKTSDGAGTLLRGKRDPRNALGEGDYLQVTPIQLITAYSALVNGGQLMAPGVASLSDFHTSLHAELKIAPEHRSIIITGMRGAVQYGTAAKAHLKSPSLYVFGKTGTSTPLQGFRTQGWFVGFAAQPNEEALPAPADVQLAVLVFLRHAHGADAAMLSRGIFEAYERISGGETGGNGDGVTGRGGDGNREDKNRDDAESPHPPIPPSPTLPVPSLPTRIRVHQVRENITTEMSLEDYVLGVVTAEGSMEDQTEALKALAVAARTYAVKNAGRHARDGFDFCTTTHCERFFPPTRRAAVRPAILNAVKQTAGEILRDETGQLADSYFSASCGGMTANLQTLWGAKAPSYLQGVPDEYCATMPHHVWTDVIPAAQLLQALRSDGRTDPGGGLSNVTVSRRDATGRAELIMIDGERQRTVNGWDFKIIVGRKLGWNLLKSSRFEVVRSGSNFIFRGSGFGHGLGLCQEGSHVMAQRGASYHQILGKYFPTTSVAGARNEVTGRGGDGETVGVGDGKTGRRGAWGIGSWEELAASPDVTFNARDSRDYWQGDILWSIAPSPHPPISPFPIAPSPLPLFPLPPSPSPRLSISSEHFRLSYPATDDHKTAEQILRTLESARANFINRVSNAGVSVNQIPSLDIFMNDTTGNFVGRTGQPWWAAAATKGNQIELQPIAVLERRGVLATTLRHELAHVVIDLVSRSRAPRWLAEGAALYLAGEGSMISRYESRSRMTTAEIEQNLAKPSSAEKMRAAYAAAYREVMNLIKSEGETNLWRRIARS